MSATAVTQIIYLSIDPSKDLTKPNSEAGRTWADALNVVERHVGFRRLYWGRSPEDMSKVQLHVGELITTAHSGHTSMSLSTW